MHFFFLFFHKTRLQCLRSLCSLTRNNAEMSIRSFLAFGLHQDAHVSHGGNCSSMMRSLALSVPVRKSRHVPPPYTYDTKVLGLVGLFSPRAERWITSLPRVSPKLAQLERITLSFFPSLWRTSRLRCKKSVTLGLHCYSM